MDKIGKRERHNRNQRSILLLISVVWVMYIRMDAERNNDRNIENIERREKIVYGHQISTKNMIHCRSPKYTCWKLKEKMQGTSP